MAILFRRQIFLFILGILLLSCGIYLYCTGVAIVWCVAPTTLGLTLCIHYPFEIYCHWRHRAIFQKLIDEGSYKSVVKKPFLDNWPVPAVFLVVMVTCLYGELSEPYYRFHYVIFYLSFIPAQAYIVMWVLSALKFEIYHTDSVMVFGLGVDLETYDYKGITSWVLQDKAPDDIHLFFEKRNLIIKLQSTMPQYARVRAMLEADYRAIREYNVNTRSKFRGTFDSLLLLYPIITLLVTFLVIAVCEIFHYYHLPEDELVYLPNQKINSLSNNHIRVGLAQHLGFVFDARVVHRLRLKDAPLEIGEIVDIAILQSDYASMQRIKQAQSYWERHLPGMVDRVAFVRSPTRARSCLVRMTIRRPFK